MASSASGGTPSVGRPMPFMLDEDSDLLFVLDDVEEQEMWSEF